MSDLEGALRAVIENPDDLGARLAYADALEAGNDPLGEFIRLDCRLDPSNADDDDSLTLWDRRVALLEEHGETWLAPLKGLVESTHIERGLVEWVALDLDTFLAHAGVILGRFPVRSLSICGTHGRIGELLSSPWIDRIEYLSLHNEDPSRETGLTDEDVEELARSDRPRRLRCIDLKYNRRLGPRSVEAILGAPWCDQLEYLELRWTSVGDEGAALIASADRLNGLCRLNLSSCGLGPAGARALADSATLARLGLTELDFSWNVDLGMREMHSCSVPPSWPESAF